MASSTVFYRKLYLSIALGLLVLTGFSAFALFSLDKLVREKNDLVSVHAEELLLAQQLIYQRAQQFQAIPVFVLSGDNNMVREHELAHQKFLEILHKLLALEIKGRKHDLLQRILANELVLTEASVEGIRLRNNGASIETVHKYFTAPERGAFALALTQDLQEFLDIEMREYAQAKNADADLSRSILVALGLAFFFCLAFVGCLVALTIKFTREKILVERRDASISQARREIVDTVSHDLKNPLASIRLSLQLMQRKLASDPNGLSKSLALITKSVDSMERLIRDLLDHTKLETGHLVLNRQSCDLTDFLVDLQERFQPLAEAKQIQLQLEVPSERRSVNCDRGRIEQVVSNLLGNAIKFTPAGGRLQLSLRFEGGKAKIAVRDSGPGMPTEQAAHVFERYWQARESASQGSGLGLAIAKGIVDAHEGAIAVDTAPGAGANFHFSLPLGSAGPSA